MSGDNDIKWYVNGYEMRWMVIMRCFSKMIVVKWSRMTRGNYLKCNRVNLKKKD